ncbi:hypothetical protein [Clostridium amazonitimonense]|uniref:hypothetical protein n=1 Tax=Clostridium amazonitimonense TaxID=1499689 RepID=UPI000A792C60|nr:hypothetical protein [Clostridium amazonitimonense]
MKKKIKSIIVNNYKEDSISRVLIEKLSEIMALNLNDEEIEYLYNLYTESERK